jgi:hypothetical protein
MTSNSDEPRNPDEAAVLGATLAAAISISVAEGPWEPIESVIGLVLIVVILAYMEPHKSRGSQGSAPRRSAVAAVLGLCLSLALAWPLEQLFGNTDPRAPVEETLWPGALPIVWAVTTALAMWLLSGRAAPRAHRRRGRSRPGRRRGSSPAAGAGRSSG